MFPWSQRASAHPAEEKKRFNTTLSRPKGGASLTGKRWDLSCFTMGKPIGKGRFGEGMNWFTCQFVSISWYSG